MFGGETVSIPLLYTSLVHTGYINTTDFYCGYICSFLLPGPTINASIFIGTIINSKWGFISWIAIYFPSFLYVWAVLPFWK